MTPRWRLTAGAAALIACVQYLLAEAIAAAAWTVPYSYSRNFISDLGVTTCIGSGPCSPLGQVMNAGFILSGGLAIVAAVLLMPLLASRLSRVLALALSLVHGAGSIIVGLVHSAPGTVEGTPHLHVMGAYAAIVGGNLALMAAGLSASRLWASRLFRAFSVAAGLFGLGCGLSLVLTRGLPPGLLERGAVDTITVWEVATGISLALSLRRRKSFPAA